MYTGSTVLSFKHGKVNPPTAYNMLRDFIKLDRGDWVVQNGGNSAVSQPDSVSMILV